MEGQTHQYLLVLSQGPTITHTNKWLLLVVYFPQAVVLFSNSRCRPILSTSADDRGWRHLYYIGRRCIYGCRRPVARAGALLLACYYQDPLIRRGPPRSRQDPSFARNRNSPGEVRMGDFSRVLQSTREHT